MIDGIDFRDFEAEKIAPPVGPSPNPRDWHVTRDGQRAVQTAKVQPDGDCGLRASVQQTDEKRVLGRLPH